MSEWFDYDLDYDLDYGDDRPKQYKAELLTVLAAHDREARHAAQQPTRGQIEALDTFTFDDPDVDPSELFVPLAAVLALFDWDATTIEKGIDHG